MTTTDSSLQLSFAMSWPLLARSWQMTKLMRWSEKLIRTETDALTVWFDFLSRIHIEVLTRLQITSSSNSWCKSRVVQYIRFRRAILTALYAKAAGLHNDPLDRWFGADGYGIMIFGESNYGSPLYLVRVWKIIVEGIAAFCSVIYWCCPIFDSALPFELELLEKPQVKKIT